MLGTLGFARRSQPRFSGEELEFLGVIAQYAAVALDRLGAARDLAKVAAEREQAEAQLRYQRDTLERIIQGAPLTDILKRLTGELALLADRELTASVLLVDEHGRYQQPIMAHPLPPDWPQPVAMPEAEFYRREAMKAEARICWSAPITSSTGQILGAIALHYARPSEPNALELRLVDIVSRMASIAIERKQSEQALKDSQAKLREHAQNLETRVTERTTSLREAVAQMEEFSYSVSHDLRSPLRAMQGYASALMEDFGAKLDEQGRHYLHRIINSSSRMERLIQDILTYSRLSRRELYPQPVLLERLVNDIIQQYPEMQPPNAVIQVDPLLNVVAHEPSLSQAISNLLSNAVKFIPAETTPQSGCGRKPATATSASGCRTMASACAARISIAFSACSNACTRTKNIPARASAWPSCAGPWIAWAARRAWSPTACAAANSGWNSRRVSGVRLTAVPQQLIAAAQTLSAAVGKLRFAAPVAYIYNPLTYAWAGHQMYLERFGRERKEVVFMGMNPGPFGMAQTGVPFGEVAAVRDWMKISAAIARPKREHPRRPIQGFDCPRREISGQRLWKLFADRFGPAEAFFARHFVVNYCPLAFVEESGRNRTPDKLPVAEAEALARACDAHLRAVLEILQPKWVVGIGDFAAKRAQLAAGDLPLRIGRVLHPSPASPLANRDWAGQATAQLRAQTIWG